jgi:ABC-type oligopeptide transport system substrate-binding subunit/DNA-binding SARP family transcriptional activator
MSHLVVFLLGPPRIELDGMPLDVNRRKAMALVVYLTMTGHHHSRDALATLFWPDYDQAQARAALRRTLSVLKQLLGEWLEIDRESVGLKPDAGVWLDVSRFSHLVANCPPSADLDCSACLAPLAEAAILYRDDFLAGFTLRDCPDFDEWQFFQNESLRRELAGALERLVTCHSARQEFEPAIAYARRWLSLDPLHEPAHRQLMQLYAWSNQRAAALRQYQECVRLLQEELGVTPSPETTALYEHIRSSAGKQGSRGAGVHKNQDSFSPILQPSTSPSLNSATFQPSNLPTFQPSPFVARERELAQLDYFLNAALTGRGQVALIVGEAGSGKTALLYEFARQAQAAHSDLIVAIGHCNTHTGVGDPYLPFRELLGLLSGDIEAKWARGVITQESGRRLRNLQPIAVQTLTRLGPDLVDNFVPSLAVNRPETRGKAGNGATNGTQHELFEQFNHVLQSLAQYQPLLLGLDDLQWADVASLNLLFHLGRQFEGSRILLALAYRPDDVALGRPVTGSGARERHPLEPIVNELKRRYGEIEIDLNRAMDRHFVEAFVDTQPNELGPEFREGLYRQTQGHPLFTVELLRDMQERGDIARNEQGRWVEGRAIHWDTLPARVEAVIAERIDRLEPELREILSVASVEGRDFTAQVIARLLQLPERQALRLLSQELAKRHLLVRESGEARVGDQRLFRYQFVHILFQHYLYYELSAGERRLWHREVAAALEEFYAGQTEAITVQLAHHYAEAGQRDKAIDYLLAAGDKARDLYAHQEAADFYQRALSFLREQGSAGRERAARTLMKLGLTYHLAFDFRQAHRSYEEGFALWQWSATERPAPPPAPHALRLIHSGAPHSLDPSWAGDAKSVYVIDQLFSGLVALSPELDIMPEIARSWEVLEGGRSYIFHLRDDITWSDGLPLTAEDFVYGWQRVLHPATQSFIANLLYDLRGAKAYHHSETTNPHSLGVRALDPITLLVELEQPTGYFPHLLANSIASPLPRHILEKYGSAWTEAERMVSNGPFRLKQWRHGQGMAFVRNPHYRGQVSGNVQEVELLFVEDSATILERYEADELDVLYLGRLTPPDRERARQRHAEEYVFGPPLDTIYIGFNVSRPPFNDMRVRQALALTTDQETLANVVLGGYDSPALGGFVPPGMPGHSPDIGLPHNPEWARQLLSEAGYPGGRGFPDVEWLVKPQQEFLAGYLQAQWQEKLGLRLAWQSIASDKLFDQLNEAPSDIFQMGWVADYLDPDNFLRVSCHRQWSDWRNEAYTDLIEQARYITDQTERLKLLRQADKILIEEAVIIPMTYHRQHLLVKPWVSQFPTSAIKIWYWKDVIIKPH